MCFDTGPLFLLPFNQPKGERLGGLILRAPWGFLLTSVGLPVMFKRDCPAMPIILKTERSHPHWEHVENLVSDENTQR